MTLDVDAILDRRRQARRISFWRGLVFVLAGIAAAVTLAVTLSPQRQHVARIAITGAIVSDRPLMQLLDSVREDDDVAAVLLSIDSPGGTSVGGERLYEALRTVAIDKPVVAHINTLGASAAYMTAMAADHIVAHRTSLTGSIGVIIQYGQVGGLLDKIGVSMDKVTSGPLKAEPDPFGSTPPEAVDVLQSVVDDSYAWFLSLVVERRGLEEATARRLADGRIYTGTQALEAGLIDEIGGEDAAVAWLARDRNLSPNLPIKTYKPRAERDFSLTARMTSAIADRILGALGITLPSFPSTGSVDGLLSLWQASFSSDTKVKNND
ncbi:signal peptide peptidase SppA [Acuticoccus yangtzensis]|uniref:signal peptide peptidase SppA n=1 Tax=Acuticoccus yangtzensis TaxID=1443441 RepID=UPI0009497F7A|nr:signal peptide peptidase SppA [Acuticoccus yangtzensis]ORE94475.1 Clp protease:peptidase U7:Signal peptide peptidase, SppA 36 kDa type [Stappia sp. 22II-S9-Z10]